MKTEVYLWSYLAEFFLEWEMLQTNVVDYTKTHILCQLFIRKRAVYDMVWANVV